MRIAIIGTGVVGGAIAFHLARRGADATLIDKGEPGSGASSHSFAWINAFGKEPRGYNALNRRALDTWDRFARLLDADVGLRWGGHLTWTSNETDAAALRRQVARLQSWGYPARMTDEREMARLEPGLRPGRVAAAAISDNDGHVDATAVAQACAKRVVDMGGAMMSNSPVAALSWENGRVSGVSTAGGEVVKCDAVVIAAGVGTTEIAALAGVRVPQSESPGVVVRTPPMPPILKSVAALYCPPLEDGQPEVHVRQGADGVLMIGEGSQESLARDDSQSHADALVGRAAQYLPALNGAKAIPVPVGYRPMPRDGLPVLGYASAAPNVYAALMHSGVTLAPLVGELAAMEIMDGARVDILAPYRPERFQ